jgi:chromosome segregation ATPase
MPKTVRLGDFCEYVANQQRAIRSVYAEIEEVQFQFNELHRQTLASWQAAVRQAVPMLLDDAQLPPEVAQSLLRAVQEEQARIEQEIADLRGRVEARRQEADAVAAEAQAGLQALRRDNPRLDADEEACKARRAAIEQEIRRLDAEIKATPWLTGLFRRRRLGREREAQRRLLAQETVRLRRVREMWQEEKRSFEINQAELRARWDAASAEAAQLQARLDYLQENLARLSRENGAGRYLAELQTVPEAPEPLRAALAEVVRLNQVRGEYEEGLRTVAEALGLLKGLAEGLERFYKSAEKVYEEQRQYNLRELHVALSDSVLNFHALWPELQAQVKDEKMLGTHPAEFSRRVRPAITGRLSEQAIAAMFESLGDALTQATKAWG